MKIIKVPKNTTGWKAGLRDNDSIVSVNDISITDQIDYKYYISDEIITCTVVNLLYHLTRARVSPM